MIIGSFIFFIITLCWYLFPPKNRNHIYGYRTISSRKSNNHWKVANKFAPQIMLYFSTLAFIISLVLSYFNFTNLEIIVTGIILLGILVSIILTELKLKKL